MNKENCKVCCEVKDCIYNENGSICQKEEIKVTNQKNKQHFCDSYKLNK